MMDPLDILTSFWKVQHSWMDHPEEMNQQVIDLFQRLEEATREEFPHILSSELPAEDKSDASEVFLEYVRRNAKLSRQFHSIFNDWLAVCPLQRGTYHGYHQPPLGWLPTEILGRGSHTTGRAG
ncbi:MAG TPA: hypothetical protein VIK19_05790 [Syntrophales bacterium]|jgi:hypothetical protein